MNPDAPPSGDLRTRLESNDTEGRIHYFETSRM